MNVRKRPRLELATAITTTAAVTAAATAAALPPALPPPPLHGSTNGASLFLTTSSSTTSGGSSSGSSSFGGMELSSGGAQIYLTICGDDDNSNESQEFYAIESIKQEPGGDLDGLHALLPTNLQLPTGCEIYLVKDTATTASALAVTAAGGKLSEQHQRQQQQQLSTIKLEPDSISSSTPSTNVLHFISGNGGGVTPTHSRPLLVTTASGKDSSSSIAPQATVAAAAPTAVPASTSASAPAPAPAHCSTAGGYNVKLDAYKKRDDKRRATHNEVERRRRDKINCWIFKLKEMLPTEGNRYKPLASPIADLADSKTPGKGSQSNGRTPPNDSKSQILIKACDYIKSMQNEIDSLRDCLREAESLQLSNQALRDELEILKQQQELHERFNTAGGSFNVTLNSLNSSATSDLFDGIDTAPNLSTVSSINFNKRGLILADYDE
ncbi:hypothetical protein KR222_002188 [Zaprionus bogoriensis]|nr:hypothetical protein KR222_002188 [Zaprionus bogoriensis]